MEEPESDSPKPSQVQGIDVLVHAQKVLGDVRSAKRSIEINSELDETEKAFVDLVQALEGTGNEG